MAAGLPARLEINSYEQRVYLDLPSARELVTTRSVLGKSLQVTGEKELVEGKRNLIWVGVGVADLPMLRIRYQERLPKGDGIKCRVEIVKVKAHTERRLVCEL